MITPEEQPDPDKFSKKEILGQFPLTRAFLNFDTEALQPQSETLEIELNRHFGDRWKNMLYYLYYIGRDTGIFSRDISDQEVGGLVSGGFFVGYEIGEDASLFTEDIVDTYGLGINPRLVADPELKIRVLTYFKCLLTVGAEFKKLKPPEVSNPFREFISSIADIDNI